MLRFLATFAAATGLLLVAGCPGSSKPSQAGPAAPADRKVICASFYPLYSILLNITREVPGLRVESLTPPDAGCLHDYELSPRDLKNLSEADALFAMGLDMEPFLDKLAPRLPRLRVINAGELVRSSRPELLLPSGQQGESRAHPHPAFNAHLWLDPAGQDQLVEKLTQALCQIDPAHAEIFGQNARAYRNEIRKISGRAQALREEARPGQPPVVATHESLVYIARACGLEVVALLETEPDLPPNAARLAQVSRLMREKGVRFILAEESSSAKVADTLARETGATVELLDPAVTGPADPGQARTSWLQAMTGNLNKLEKIIKDSTGQDPGKKEIN